MAHYRGFINGGVRSEMLASLSFIHSPGREVEVRYSVSGQDLALLSCCFSRGICVGCVNIPLPRGDRGDYV
jgi:hypothetical protein